MRKSRSSPEVKAAAHYCDPSDHYCYPDSDVLKNKYGLKNKKDFQKKYAHDLAQQIVNLRQEPPPDQINSDYLTSLHYRLFCNTYEWAGMTRNIPFKFLDGSTAYMPKMEKENSTAVFAEGDEILKSLREFDQSLVEWNYLKGLPRKQFAEVAAQMFVYLNHIQPFRSGNGCTQRMFFEKLADSAGHYLDFSLVTPVRMNLASKLSLEENDVSHMRYLFDDISHPEKARLLRECREYMENKKEFTERLIVTVDEGETYTGIYKGARSHGFTVDVKGVHVVGLIDYLTPEQIKTWKPGDEVTFTAPMHKDINKIFIPRENLAPLTENEISEKIENNISVQESLNEVKHLLKTVYGKSDILNTQLDIINTDPQSGSQLIEQIMQNPQSVGKIMGTNLCGIKNHARREADNAFTPLCETLTNHIDIVKNTRRNILQEHKAEQTRLAKQVNMPSEALKETLFFSKEEQQEILASSPALQSELNSFVQKIDERLSPNERHMLKNSHFMKVASNIGTSLDKARDIAMFTLTAKEAHQEQAQLARLNRSKEMAMAS
ncbi:BID domain-containing T4SS effector [Bartonella sp. cb54]|uniref:BID domain-containing T4SS effector n=1 Tax=Bartonella sp. cb54 TaxID=3385560 RepID=UPI0039A41609